jgi:predicted transcriptional regulator
MRISKEKRDKISEQILSFLFHTHPNAKFTVDIARELARDEEFTKSLMLDLRKKNLVNDIRKNPEGIDYSRRIRWRLSNQAYSAYKTL